MCQTGNDQVTVLALGLAVLLACSSGRDLDSRGDRSHAPREAEGKDDRPNDDRTDSNPRTGTENGGDEQGTAGSPPTAPPDPSDALRDHYGIDSDPPHPLFDPAVVRHYEVTVDPEEWAHINETAFLEEYIKGTLT